MLHRAGFLINLPLPLFYYIMNNCFKISDSTFWDEINQAFGNKGGVYKLISKQNGNVVPTHRFLGTDEEGILYIGKASVFLDRVISLKKSIMPNYRSASHICGRRYNKLCTISRIAEKFPLETLHVQLIADEYPSMLEGKLLKSYEEKFGEVPPLNAISGGITLLVPEVTNEQEAIPDLMNLKTPLT